ncbi:hypothetical protein VDGL01_02213 [Verticillium dahliae]
MQPSGTTLTMLTVAANRETVPSEGQGISRPLHAASLSVACEESPASNLITPAPFLNGNRLPRPTLPTWQPLALPCADQTGWMAKILVSPGHLQGVGVGI